MASETHGHRRYRLDLYRDDDREHPIEFWLDVRKKTSSDKDPKHSNLRLCPNSSARVWEEVQGERVTYTGVNPCKWGMVTDPQAMYKLQVHGKGGLPKELKLWLDFRAERNIETGHDDSLSLLGCIIPANAFPTVVGEKTLAIHDEFTKGLGSEKSGIRYTFEILFEKEEDGVSNEKCGYKEGELGFGSIIAIENGLHSDPNQTPN